jgi:cell division protein FtsL
VPPRRVSGSVALPRARAGVAPPPAPFGRWNDALRGLPDARWLDRLLRGRAWIALIAVALIGIVAMQVHLLKLNGGIGRAVEHSATLERQNSELRSAVAALSSQERIQGAAAQLGLVMPPAGDVRYVRARGPVDARRAVKTMRTPNTAEEVAAARLALAQQQAALGLAPAATPDAAAAAGAGAGTTLAPADPATGAPAATPDPAAAAVATAPAPAGVATPTAPAAPVAEPAAAATPATATATGAAAVPAGTE